MSYPLIGSILVAKNGSVLVHVWPNESEGQRCFTGVSLLDGECSSMWLRSHFEQENVFRRPLLQQYREARRVAG